MGIDVTRVKSLKVGVDKRQNPWYNQDMNYSHPIYARLFKGTVTEFIDKPCLLENGEVLWQQCYICGMSIQFNKDMGRWQRIGNGLIRHKDCEPPPYRGKSL